MKKVTYLMAAFVTGLASTATPVRAGVVFITGPTSPADEDVLFNLPGLIQTGNPVQGRTELTGAVLNFTVPFQSPPLTTTLPGEPRIAIPGFTFNSLRFRFDDPQISFTQLDFAVNADQVGSITFEAITTDGRTFSAMSNLNAPFINPFSVVAVDGQRIQEVRYACPAPFTVDVRRIRVGGVVPVPEPDSRHLLTSGLLLLAAVVLHRRDG